MKETYSKSCFSEVVKTDFRPPVLQIRIFRIACDFFVWVQQRLSGQGVWLAFAKDPLGGSWGEIVQKNSILKISKAEFGLTKELFYSSKSQNLYGIILRSPWLGKGKFNHRVSIVLLKCLVLA